MAEIIPFPKIKKQKAQFDCELCCPLCGFDAFNLFKIRGLLVSTCIQCDAEMIVIT